MRERRRRTSPPVVTRRTDRPRNGMTCPNSGRMRRVRPASVAAEHIQEPDLLSLLMRHSPDIIFFKEADGRYISTNFADATLLGFDDPAQIVGKTDFDLLPPESA